MINKALILDKSLANFVVKSPFIYIVFSPTYIYDWSLRQLNVHNVFSLRLTIQNLYATTYWFYRP